MVIDIPSSPAPADSSRSSQPVLHRGVLGTNQLNSSQVSPATAQPHALADAEEDCPKCEKTDSVDDRDIYPEQVS